MPKLVCPDAHRAVETRLLSRAAFCDLFTNGNPVLADFHQKLDALNGYIVDKRIPKPMAIRMRAYLNQRHKNVMVAEHNEEALPLLSLSLSIEAVLHVNRKWLNNTWFLRDLELPVKARLAMQMSTRVLAPCEVAPDRHLYLMIHGRAKLGYRFIPPGTVWGDDVLLTHRPYFSTHLARAITFSSVSCIPREEL